MSDAERGNVVEDRLTDSLQGGCACGAVRYRLEDAPIITHCCHCRFCQRMSGSAFGVNAMTETDRVTLLGIEPEAVATPSTLPAGQKFHRCPRCQVALWSNHPLMGDAVAFVFVGTLDEPALLVPTVHCYTASKAAWVTLDPAVPAYEGDYDIDRVWSDAAKARIAAAMGGQA
jgi:hypothetical protein